MGRPVVGDPVTVRMEADLLQAVDSARGEQSRAQWLRAAARRALAPRVRGVALGIRVEFYDDAGLILGAISREDVDGVTVPHAGDQLGRASLSPLVNRVAGADLTVHHVDHYLVTPDSADTGGLAVVVCHATVPFRTAITEADALRAEGWHLHSLERVGA